MPFLERESPRARNLLPMEAEQERPALGETIAAGFRQENTVANIARVLRDYQSFEPEKDYDPVEHLRGTPYEGNHLDRFVTSRSAAETEHIMRRIDQENENRETLAASGFAGVVSSIAGGLIDPTIVLPGGALYRTARGGVSIGRTAMSVGGAGAAAAGVAEGVLGMTQETRTREEMALNIGASTILSGLLGGGAASLLSRAERRALDQALAADIRRMEGRAPDEAAGLADGSDGRTEMPDLSSDGARIPDMPDDTVRPAGDPANMDVPAMRDAGAAMADRRTGLLASTGLSEVPWLSTAFERMSPTHRLLASENVASRRAVSDLAESALMSVDAQRGVTPTRAGGPAAERETALAQRQTLVAMDDVIEDAWLRYRFGSRESAPWFARQRDALDEMRGTGAGGKLSFGRFDEEVGRAMRAGDRHEVPEVADVARWVRQNVFEPWKERAIKQGLLPEGVEVSTAESYFMRSYNREAMKARAPEVRRRVTDWLEAEQTRKRDIQTKIEALDDQRRAVADQVRKVEDRIARSERRLAELDARQAERQMATRDAANREEVLTERVADQAEALSELEEAVAAFRSQTVAPELRGRIADLEANVRALRREEARSRMSEKDLEKARKAEEDAYLADDFVGKVADMVVGRRNPPKVPSFVQWIVDAGGIVDQGGDVRAMMGGAPQARPGLLNRNSGSSIDEIGERLADEFHWMFPERPSEADVLEMIDASLRGAEPHWFVESRLAPDEQDLVRVSDDIDDIRRAMDESGYPLNSRRDYARFMLDNQEALPAGPERFDAPGADPIPAGVRLESAEGSLAGVRDRVEEIRDVAERARRRADTVDRRLGQDEARLDEVQRVRGRGDRRMDELSRQEAIASERRALQDEMMAIARAHEESVYRAIETELEQWGGKSARDALSSIRARDKAATEAGRSADAPRLRGADRDIRSAVRRIIGSDRDMSRQELEARAGEIYDRIISTPDGRLPYDEASTGGAAGASSRDRPRGALASREFMIPDEVLDDLGVLDNSALQGVRGFMHGTVPDIVLTERFGDFNLTDQIKQINEQAQELIAQDPKRSTQIIEQRDRDIKALAGIRDRIRGVYASGGDATSRHAGRIGSFLRFFNMAVDLGGATVSSIPDLGNPIFRWGFTRVFGDAWRPFVRGLVGASDGFAQAKRQYRAMGIGVEMALLTRSRSINDISASYRAESRIERTMQVIGEGSQILNLQAPWTDMTRTIASIVSGNEIFRAARAVSQGNATAKQVRDLASSGIDQSLARRIWSEFERGGEVVDGVHLPNTADWQDAAARRAFEGAVAREADITVVNPGQEKPLWMSTPILGLIGQHKSFIMGATERILLANLQRRDAHTLAGFMTMISLGMVASALYSINSGKGFPERPQDWVKEGISRSGVLGWLEEANSITAQATSGGIDAYRLIGADRPLQRFSSRSVLERAMGPTVGKINTVTGLTSAPFGEEGWNARDTANLRRLAPYQNLFYIRRLLNEVEDGVNQSLGIDPLDQR